MPTATSISQVLLNHIGPLTSTWTAPVSCPTVQNVRLGYSGLPEAVAWLGSCTVPSLGPCFPSGSAIDSIVSSITKSPLGYINYFSPGALCPQAWTTVGVAVKDSAGSLSANGIFNPVAAVTTRIPSGPYVRVSNTNPNILMEAMSPGETAIACCPRYEPLRS
jgi:hypothetical protein